MGDGDREPGARDSRYERDAERLRKRDFQIDWKVIGFILFAGVVGVSWIALRIGEPLDEHAARQAQRELAREMARLEEQARLPPAADPVVPEAPAPLDVVEWVLHVGEWSTEVDRERIDLPGDVPVRIVSRERVAWSSEELSLVHPAGARVTATGEGEERVVEVALGGRRIVRVEAVAPAEEPTEHLDAWAGRLEHRLRATRAPEAPTERIGGETTTGVRLLTDDGPLVDLFVAPLSPERTVRVSLFLPGPNAPVGSVGRVLRSLSAEPREDLAVADLSYLGVLHPLPLDEPTAVASLPGAPEVRLARRAATRRKLGGVWLEHPPDCVVVVEDGPLPRIGLERGGASLAVVATVGVEPEELLRSVEGTVAAHADQLRSDAVRVGGWTVGMILSHDRGARREAEALLEAVRSSLTPALD